ncbi:MAG: glucuronate isomerase [Pseudomonadota bacterium]
MELFEDMTEPSRNQENGLLDPNRLFPVENRARGIAQMLFGEVEQLPIISPHGHTDPRWYAENKAFGNATDLIVKPDHYLLRMLVSQGISLDDLGIPRNGVAPNIDPRQVWQLFAEQYYLFRGTPSRMWLDHTFSTLFGLDVPLGADTADQYYETINEHLALPEFLPRALFERFNIEVIATTESALDNLEYHDAILASDWNHRVVTTYRPDSVIDPDFEGFAENVRKFGELTSSDTTSYSGYLDAHRIRRQYFRKRGATATDHGHPTSRTAALPDRDASALFESVIAGKHTEAEAEMFRAQMLTEMARMSVEDGLVMQIHPGSRRNHSDEIMKHYGRDKGFDIPSQTNYVDALKPLLDEVGLEPNLTLILFTLDETAYSRELAPLAGAYPCLRLGPAWWFYDSPEGMMRYRQLVTETAGFYNTVGFNDDTRAFCSIPARHDMARRVDCAFLADTVARGMLREAEAVELAHDLAYGLAKKAYRL